MTGVDIHGEEERAETHIKFAIHELVHSSSATWASSFEAFKAESDEEVENCWGRKEEIEPLIEQAAARATAASAAIENAVRKFERCTLTSRGAALRELEMECTGALAEYDGTPKQMENIITEALVRHKQVLQHEQDEFMAECAKAKSVMAQAVAGANMTEMARLGKEFDALNTRAEAMGLDLATHSSFSFHLRDGASSTTTPMLSAIAVSMHFKRLNPLFFFNTFYLFFSLDRRSPPGKPLCVALTLPSPVRVLSWRPVLTVGNRGERGT